MGVFGFYGIIYIFRNKYCNIVILLEDEKVCLIVKYYKLNDDRFGICMW